MTEAIRRGMETIDGGNIVPCIFVIPAYGGHMPELAKRKFNDVVSQDHRPAVLVAVYGNRAFENALTDLDAFVRERGFNPVAAGALDFKSPFAVPLSENFSLRKSPRWIL